MAAMIDDLRDPLDTLILQGQVLADRLRRLPIRRIAVLGESAERVLLALVKIDAQLTEIAAAMSDPGIPAYGRIPHADLVPAERQIEVVVRDVIDAIGGNRELFDVQASILPEGWVRISVEDGGTGGAAGIDLHRLVEIIERRLGELGLVTVSEILTERGGHILARPGRLGVAAARQNDQHRSLP
jgi:hypothetical protein